MNTADIFLDDHANASLNLQKLDTQYSYFLLDLLQAHSVKKAKVCSSVHPSVLLSICSSICSSAKPSTASKHHPSSFILYLFPSQKQDSSSLTPPTHLSKLGLTHAGCPVISQIFTFCMTTFFLTAPSKKYLVLVRHVETYLDTKLLSPAPTRCNDISVKEHCSLLFSYYSWSAYCSLEVIFDTILLKTHGQRKRANCTQRYLK